MGSGIQLFLPQIMSKISDIPVLSNKQGHLTIYGLRMLFTFLLVASGSNSLDVKQNIGTKAFSILK